MSDEEIICGWMEPNPYSRTRSRDSEGGWWRLIGWYRKTGTWHPRMDWTLDALHLVEKRLTDEQWFAYCAEFAVANLPEPTSNPGYKETVAWDRAHLHADAKQKIKALAAVLRVEVGR